MQNKCRTITQFWCETEFKEILDRYDSSVHPALTKTYFATIAWTTTTRTSFCMGSFIVCSCKEYINTAGKWRFMRRLLVVKKCCPRNSMVIWVSFFYWNIIIFHQLTYSQKECSEKNLFEGNTQDKKCDANGYGTRGLEDDKGSKNIITVRRLNLRRGKDNSRT